MKLTIKYMNPLIFCGFIIPLFINLRLQKSLPADIPIARQQQAISIPAKSDTSTQPFYNSVLIKLFTH